MKIIRNTNLEQLPCVVTIGNFDGVHLGHQALLTEVKKRAHNLKLESAVITFEPNPKDYISQNKPQTRISSLREKIELFNEIKIDRVHIIKFNQEFSKVTANEFISVLIKQLKVKEIVVGEDFCFGKDRKGNVKILKDLGADLGFGVSSLELIKGKHGEISSTSIRNLLSEGKPKEAASHLGHWHRIEGPVVGGEQRGRVLGYPTANMELSGLHIPKLGVYAVLIDILDGPYKGSFKGAASIGVRPMFGKNSPNLETYIFDFSGDIYGAQVSIALVEYLRPELSFDSVEALVEQMASDCEKAKETLA